MRAEDADGICRPAVDLAFSAPELMDENGLGAVDTCGGWFKGVWPCDAGRRTQKPPVMRAQKAPFVTLQRSNTASHDEHSCASRSRMFNEFWLAAVFDPTSPFGEVTLRNPSKIHLVGPVAVRADRTLAVMGSRIVHRQPPTRIPVEGALPPAEKPGIRSGLPYFPLFGLAPAPSVIVPGG